jgi:hypothetical protein
MQPQVWDGKGMEVKLWYNEHDLQPDWLFKGAGLPHPIGTVVSNAPSVGTLGTNTERRGSASLVSMVKTRSNLVLPDWDPLPK